MFIYILCYKDILYLPIAFLTLVDSFRLCNGTQGRQEVAVPKHALSHVAGHRPLLGEDGQLEAAPPAAHPPLWLVITIYS